MSKSSGDLPGRQQWMDAGALGSHVDEFTLRLSSLAYTRLTVADYEASARHFAQWLQLAGIAAGRIDDAVVWRFARHRCRCPGARRHDRISAKYVNRVRRFVGFLVEQGAAPPLAPARPAATDSQVVEFQDWLRRHRGISERTIGRHGRMLMRLLPALGTDTKAYNAALIRRAVLTEAERATPAHVKTMTQALRGFLRFLAANGMTKPCLEQAVPTIPQWRFVRSAALHRRSRDRAIDCLMRSIRAAWRPRPGDLAPPGAPRLAGRRYSHHAPWRHRMGTSDPAGSRQSAARDPVAAAAGCRRRFAGLS